MTEPHPSPADHPKASRLGNVLFLIYLAVYAGFVWIAAFAGGIMGSKPFGGVNLAIIYGFVLIILPLILSLIYLRWAGKAKD